MLAVLLGLYLVVVGFVWWCAEDERNLLGRPRRSRREASLDEPAALPALPAWAADGPCRPGATRSHGQRAA
jgi:hypothetical protein